MLYQITVNKKLKYVRISTAMYMIKIVDCTAMHLWNTIVYHTPQSVHVDYQQATVTVL